MQISLVLTKYYDRCVNRWRLHRLSGEAHCSHRWHIFPLISLPVFSVALVFDCKGRAKAIVSAVIVCSFPPTLITTPLSVILSIVAPVIIVAGFSAIQRINWNLSSPVMPSPISVPLAMIVTFLPRLIKNSASSQP